MQLAEPNTQVKCNGNCSLLQILYMKYQQSNVYTSNSSYLKLSSTVRLYQVSVLLGMLQNVAYLIFFYIFVWSFDKQYWWCICSSSIVTVDVHIYIIVALSTHFFRCFLWEENKRVGDKKCAQNIACLLCTYGALSKNGNCCPQTM